MEQNNVFQRFCRAEMPVRVLPNSYQNQKQHEYEKVSFSNLSRKGREIDQIDQRKKNTLKYGNHEK